MAITLIRKPNEKDPTKRDNIKFKTENIYIEVGTKGDTEEKLFALVADVDDNLKAISKVAKYEVVVTEEVFHKQLRKESAKYHHLVTSHSTNPEWNPEGYKRNMEDDLGK